jgi:hypothetical protein
LYSRLAKHVVLFHEVHHHDGSLPNAFQGKKEKMRRHLEKLSSNSSLSRLFGWFFSHFCCMSFIIGRNSNLIFKKSITCFSSRIENLLWFHWKNGIITVEKLNSSNIFAFDCLLFFYFSIKHSVHHHKFIVFLVS